MLRVLIVGITLLVMTAGTAVADETIDNLRTVLQKIVPNTTPDSINPSEIAGIYEVVYGIEVFYVSADGRYLLNGNLIDLKLGKDLSEGQRAAGRLKLIESVPESDMIVYAPKEVKYRLTVFTDIDCPYCRRMHEEMAELNDLGIEVRYLFFPRTGVNTRSYKKAVAVWCADDRLQALTDSKAGKDVAQKQCDNPVDEHMALVAKLGITGTPTMVLDDGEVIPGYIPAARLVSMLEKGRGMQE